MPSRSSATAATGTRASIARSAIAAPPRAGTASATAATPSGKG